MQLLRPQDNLHCFRCFFFYKKVLGGSWKLYGTRGHPLICILLFFSSPRLLSLLREVSKGGCNIGCAILPHLYHLGLDINPQTRGNRLSDGKGIVYVLCLPKRGWSLNPSPVESFIPHLGAISPTYPRDLSLKGFLGLCHSGVVPIFLGLILRPLCLFLCLLGLFQFLLKRNDLTFGGGQLILSVANEHPLSPGLLFNTIRVAATLFLSLSSANSFFLSSWLLFLAKIKASMAALRLPSSSFICWWQ